MNPERRSFIQLQRKRLDLIAVHNLQDIESQVPLLHELKSAGRVRYVGATTSSDRQYPAFEAMMKKQAASGRLPDAATCKRMESFIDAL